MHPTLEWALRIAVFVVLAAQPTGASSMVDPVDPAQLREFTGRYTFLDHARDRMSYEQGIERAVSSLNPLVRGFARARIRDSLRPERHITIESQHASHVRLQLDEWRSPTLRTSGGTRFAPGPDGNRARFSIRHQNRRLVLRAVGEEGMRESIFSLSPAADYLFLQVRITAVQLPESIRYTLTFRRDG